MADLLAVLAARARGELDTVLPRLPARFEATGAGHASPLVETAPDGELDVVERTEAPGDTEVGPIRAATSGQVRLRSVSSPVPASPEPPAPGTLPAPTPTPPDDFRDDVPPAARVDVSEPIAHPPVTRSDPSRSPSSHPPRVGDRSAPATRPDAQPPPTGRLPADRPVEAPRSRPRRPGVAEAPPDADHDVASAQDPVESVTTVASTSVVAPHESAAIGDARSTPAAAGDHDLDPVVEPRPAAVTVTIGTVEVRTAPPRPTESTAGRADRPSRPAPRLSLADHLSRHRGGGR